MAPLRSERTGWPRVVSFDHFVAGFDLSFVVESERPWFGNIDASGPTDCGIDFHIFQFDLSAGVKLFRENLLRVTAQTFDGGKDGAFSIDFVVEFGASVENHAGWECRLKIEKSYLGCDDWEIF